MDWEPAIHPTFSSNSLIMMLQYPQEIKMKKVLAIMIIALVVMTTAFAFSFKSVGIEVGQGVLASLDMDIIDNLDVYARLGYTGMFNISVGAQYKVLEFDVGNTPVAFKPGLQANFNLGQGFMFTGLATLDFSFETKDLTAFLRPGLGVSMFKGGNAFAWTVEAGVGYLIK
jgi:hypothetical protein